MTNRQLNPVFRASPCPRQQFGPSLPGKRKRLRLATDRYALGDTTELAGAQDYAYIDESLK